MAQKNWKEILMKYKGYILVIFILLVAVFTLVRGCGSDGTEEGQAPEASMVAQEEETTEENKLEENTHSSVERLVTKFLDCLMSGDVEALEPITDYLSEDDKAVITSRAKIYESYSNLKCYTKNGPEEDSFIVYLCYDIKFAEITGVKTLVPDIRCLYVSAKDEDGNRYIRYHNVENDEELQAYVRELEEDPDVKALCDDVRTRYQEALESDEALYKFLQDATGQVAEEAEEETPEETEAEPEEEAEAEPEVTEEPAEATAQNRETRVTESVNVRAEASTESERLALAYQGDAITQIESYDNGWSKVEYKGLTGYVKTEYLE